MSDISGSFRTLAAVIIVFSGMVRKIYCFNPSHDAALANNTPFYKPSGEIVRMAYDLAVLPVWYAEAGSKVKVSEWKQVELLRSQTGDADLLRGAAWTLEWESAEYVPWGWDPALLHTLRLAEVDEDFLLTDPQMERVRRLSGRQRSAEVLEALKCLPGVCGEAVACRSLHEVEFCMSEMGETVLKAPWSGSGRGIVKVSSASWTQSVEGWVSRILRTQGEVMAEPLYERACDFAMEFFADGCGGVFFLGYSLFETDSHGNYKGNRLCSDERIESLLSAYVPADVLRRVRASLEVELSSLLEDGYKGCLGVDMMVCRVNDEFRVHPCVEINLRMNMGIAAHEINARFVHPRSEGRFRVEHYSAQGQALETHRSLKERYPLQTVDGKIIGGYLSLTGVDADTRYQAYVLVEP